MYNGVSNKEKTMKTLIIHPKDKTTDFLKVIYQGRTDVTVISGDCTRADVESAIKKHDHIVMLGHGTPQGLLAMNQFNGKKKPIQKPSAAIRAKAGEKVSHDDVEDFYRYSSSRSVVKSPAWNEYPYGGTSIKTLTSGYIIDDDNADLLVGKKLTAIWCNADQFMEWNNLAGFYTGMFISEEAEAKMIGTAETDEWLVEQQNYAFVDVVSRYLDQDSEALHKALDSHYGPLAKHNPVAKYNLHRLYHRSASSTATGVIGVAK
jgi:hypothetical protein